MSIQASKLTGWDRKTTVHVECGGAGGIRTHEWRFCRPLPWATWVPRQTAKYSKIFGAVREGAAPKDCRFARAGYALRADSALFFCWRQWRGDFGFAQEPRGFFGRRGVDVKAGAPFEAGDFGELGNDFDVPVVVVVDLFADGRSVDHEVVRGAVEDGVEAYEGVLQHAREAGVHGALIVFVRGGVDFGEEPHLE